MNQLFYVQTLLNRAFLRNFSTGTIIWKGHFLTKKGTLPAARGCAPRTPYNFNKTLGLHTPCWPSKIVKFSNIFDYLRVKIIFCRLMHQRCKKHLIFLNTSVKQSKLLEKYGHLRYFKWGTFAPFFPDQKGYWDRKKGYWGNFPSTTPLENALLPNDNDMFEMTWNRL